MDEQSGGQKAAEETLPRRVTCAGCGRQFRSTGGPGEGSEYCPTCDYRRRRQRLDQLNAGRGDEAEED